MRIIIRKLEDCYRGEKVREKRKDGVRRKERVVKKTERGKDGNGDRE